jgi:hypothetical protein
MKKLLLLALIATGAYAQPTANWQIVQSVAQISWDEPWIGTVPANDALGSHGWGYACNFTPTFSYTSSDVNHGAVLSFTSSSSGGESCTVFGAAQYLPGTAIDWAIVNILKTDSSSTNITELGGITFGQGCNSTSGNCLGITFEPATSSDWLLITCSGFSCSHVDTGVPYANSTWFKFSLWSTISGTIVAQVNSGGIVSTSSNVPTSTLAACPLYYATNSTGAAHTFLLNKTSYIQYPVTRP